MIVTWLYFVVIALVLIVGLLFGYFARQILANQQLRSTEIEA